MNELVTTQPQLPAIPSDVDVAALQSALAGDLKQLPVSERLKFYGIVCKSTGLNPVTKPFDWIEFKGKLTLYANKGCAEQLRAIHRISLEIVERRHVGLVFVVTVKATNSQGRCDEAIGVEPLGTNPNGEAMAFAMMKAETKAKRRATLSICGLGLLDLSDTEGVTATVEQESPAQALNAEIVNESPETSPEERRATLDEIKSILQRLVPGSEVEDRRRKADILFEVVGARRWEAVCHLPNEKLTAGLEILRGKISGGSPHGAPLDPCQPQTAGASEKASGAEHVGTEGAATNAQVVGSQPELSMPARAPISPSPTAPAMATGAGPENTGGSVSEAATPAPAVKSPESAPQVTLDFQTQSALLAAIGEANVTRATKWLQDPANGGPKSGYLAPGQLLDELPKKTADRIIRNPQLFASAIKGVK